MAHSFILMTCLVFFLIQPGTIYQGVAPPCPGLALQKDSAISTTTHICVYMWKPIYKMPFQVLSLLAADGSPDGTWEMPPVFEMTCHWGVASAHWMCILYPAPKLIGWCKKQLSLQMGMWQPEKSNGLFKTRNSWNKVKSRPGIRS